MREIEAGAGLVIQRPTPGWVRLSLWLDVGSRDADPPQLATLSAYWAAQQAQASARTLPDGTELYLDCDLDAERLERCVRRLALALNGRPPSAKDMPRLLARLRDDRRRQAVSSREVELAALHNLLGDAARGLSPMGDSRDDAALTNARVAQFLQAHYGPQRALLIGAGDIDRGSLDGWAQGSSPASEQRTQRPPPHPQPGVRAMLTSRRSAAIAMLAPRLDDAARVGQAFGALYPGARASAFPMRGYSVLLLRLPLGPSPWRRLQAASFDALRLAQELDSLPEAPPGRDDLASLTRRTGEAWVTQASQPLEANEWPMSLAVGMPAAAPEAPGREGAEGAVVDEWQKHAEAAYQAASERLDPPLRGDADADHASVRLKNGVRIEVQRRPHDARFAASLQIEGGSALDPVVQHGRAALLATLAASACASASAPALAEQLRQDRARMRPLVAPQRWGVLAYGDAAQWQNGVDRLLHCTLSPSFRARDIEDARVRLIAQLRRRGETRLAWRAAQTLMPAAPGTIAAWGSPQGLAAVTVDGLRTLHKRLRQAGEGVVLRLLVPGDARRAARFAARRLSALAESKATAQPTRSAVTSSPLQSAQSDEVQSPRVWVGFVIDDGSPGLSSAVMAAATQVAHRLGALPGYRVLGIAGDSDRHSWIWLGLSVDPDQLDATPAALLAATRAVRTDVDRAVLGALREQQRARATDASDPVLALRGRFFTGDGDGDTPDEDDAAALIRKLLAQPAHFLVVHPLARD